MVWHPRQRITECGSTFNSFMMQMWISWQMIRLMNEWWSTLSIVPSSKIQWSHASPVQTWNRFRLFYLSNNFKVLCAEKAFLHFQRYTGCWIIELHETTKWNKTNNQKIKYAFYRSSGLNYFCRTLCLSNHFTSQSNMESFPVMSRQGQVHLLPHAWLAGRWVDDSMMTLECCHSPPLVVPLIHDSCR